MSKLNITFILPFVNLTGGIKILFEHANRLVERGHRVTIVYPGVLFHSDDYAIINDSWRWRYIDAPLRLLKYWFFVSVLRKTDADWFPIDRRVILKRTPDLSAHSIPDADIVIATANETADWVNTYPVQKGIKVFFCQDYEVWARPAKYVDHTLSFDMHLITIGSWQKKLFEEQFKHPVEAIIHDGVDTKRFRPARLLKRIVPDEPVRVLMVYHHLAYKGMADGFYAVEEAKKAGLNVQLVLFGVHNLQADVPKGVEYHQNLQEDELPAVYQSCHVFLWPTHREGFGLPPMEAMACGLPVVGTDAGAMPDYMKDGKTGYMIPIQQPKLLVEKLIELLKNPQQYEKMSQAAAAEMKKWDWDQQTKKLEAYLLGLKKDV